MLYLGEITLNIINDQEVVCTSLVLGDDFLQKWLTFDPSKMVQVQALFLQDLYQVKYHVYIYHYKIKAN